MLSICCADSPGIALGASWQRDLGPEERRERLRRHRHVGIRERGKTRAQDRERSLPARKRAARSASTASASASFKMSSGGNWRIHSSSLLFAALLRALTVMGSDVPAAISGRSSTQPFAIRIQPPHKRFMFGFDDRLLKILLRHVDRKTGLWRAANHDFHRVSSVDRDAFAASRARAPAARRRQRPQLGDDVRQQLQHVDDIFDACCRATARSGSRHATPSSARSSRAAHATARSSRTCRPSPSEAAMPARFKWCRMASPSRCRRRCWRCSAAGSRRRRTPCTGRC